jgi:hypothetical protein
MLGYELMNVDNQDRETGQACKQKTETHSASFENVFGDNAAV